MKGNMDKFYIGQEASTEKQFTKRDVLAFAEISGDQNPLHIDADFAGKSRFGRNIVHGILVTGLISKVIGTQMPGEGSIYLEQKVSFKKPVYVDDTVTASVKITEIAPEKGIIALETNVYNQDGQLVISGFAKVLYEG